MKILYYFCGEGLGHATRTLAAGRALAGEHEVIFASYGSARDFVSARGLPVQEVPSEIKLVGKAGKLDIQKSILSSLGKINVRSVFQHHALLKKYKPDLVLSDSFFVPAALAKARKIPVWMILNQTNIDRFFADRDEPTRWISNAVKQINYSVLDRVDRILIPDFPPPFTLCAPTVSLSPSLAEKTEYLGPLVQKNRLDLPPSKPSPSQPRILALVRGFGSEGLVEKTIRVAGWLPALQFDVVAEPTPTKMRIPPNVRIHTQVADLFRLMAPASLVICGGGHSTLMECLALAKPVLSLPYAFHFEQESNAEQLQALGLGTRIHDQTPAVVLQELIQAHLSDIPMQRRLQRMARLAQALDGRKRLVEMFREFQKTKK